MKGKPLEMSLLFDFYGDLLTEKQRELFDLYYNEDLSLSEIAENVGITRQAVRDSVKRAERTLKDMESRLGFAAKYGNTAQYSVRLAKEAELLKSLNEDTLHNRTAGEIAERLGELARLLQQEVADGF